MNLKEVLEVIFKENKYVVPYNKKGITVDKVIDGLSKGLVGLELAQHLGYATAGKASVFLIKLFNSPKDKKASERWTTYLLSKKELKICSRCGSVEPFSSFPKRANLNNGLFTQCYTCVKEDQSSEVYKRGRKERRAKLSEQELETLKAYHRAYYIRNRQQLLLKQVEYAKQHKLDKKVYDSIRFVTNRGYFKAKAAKYRASRLKATPIWANLVTIKEIYQTCPEGYHVDHIVPLQGSLVCGLHCEFNLQHLSATENLSKGNRWVP
jgi:hypothetical protein